MSDPRVIKTMCPMNCHPTLCGMTVTVQDDRLLSITGDPDNPDSLGFLCMRGKATPEIVGNPQRLSDPMIRQTPGQDDWQGIGWDGALDLIAGRMAAVGPQAVGIWQGHGIAVNDYGTGVKRGLIERFANLYGCHTWNPAMICWGLGAFGLGLTGALETSTKEDMGDHSALILLWGANTVSQAHTIRHVEQAKRRGARIVVIDVRRTEAGALADQVLLIRPGTDAALALAMMHVIVTDGTWDSDFVSAHTLGFDALRGHLADKTPAWAAALTGIDAATITALARSYAATRPAMIVLGGSSLHKGTNGWQAARAIACLPALTGDFGRPGGGIGPRHGARSHGAGFNDITARDRRKPGTYIPNQMEAIIEGLEDGRIKVLLSLGSNLLSSFPDTNRVRAALARADLVVVQDIFMNQTIREAAHVVLPSTIWLEEIGVKATNGHVHLCETALPPAGQARPVQDLLRGLADRLGVADVYPWRDQSALIDAVLDHPATGHATVAHMRAAGGHAALHISPVGHVSRTFATPSGKIEFWSQRALDMGLDPLPQAPVHRCADGMLTLAQGRSFAHFHSFYDHGLALPTLAAREPAPILWIAEADARDRGIADGDPITIHNHRGQFPALAKLTSRIPAGTVWMRDGWPGFNALSDAGAVLPDTALDSFAFSVGQSSFDTTVKVTRADI
jgi:anaerobic selenocysteine-containing dehydrogenase